MEKSRPEKKGPGGCDSRGSCDNYCGQPENARVCLQFAVDEGKISQEEADFMAGRAEFQRGPAGAGPGRRVGPGGQGGAPMEPEIDKEKALKLIEEVGGPGGCKTLEECEAFCGDMNNSDVCMNFATEHGLMPPGKIEKVKKMMAVGGPGGCKGARECDEFCSKPGNGEICMNFSIENNLVPPEEIENMRKGMNIIKKLDKQGGQGGPGGCRGPEECRNFCSDPSHMEECMNFASQSGMMSQERANGFLEQKNMIEGRIEYMNEGFRNMPPPPMRGEGFIPIGGNTIPDIFSTSTVQPYMRPNIGPNGEMASSSSYFKPDFMPRPESSSGGEIFFPGAESGGEMFQPREATSGVFMMPPREFVPPSFGGGEMMYPPRDGGMYPPPPPQEGRIYQPQGGEIAPSGPMNLIDSLMLGSVHESIFEFLTK